MPGVAIEGMSQSRIVLEGEMLMTLDVLLAEPSQLLRVGLCTIFAEDNRIKNIYEAATSEALEICLTEHQIDLIIINQLLIKEVTLLIDQLAKKCVILALELDRKVLVT